MDDNNRGEHESFRVVHLDAKEVDLRARAQLMATRAVGIHLDAKEVDLGARVQLMATQAVSSERTQSSDHTYDRSDSQ